LPFLIVSVPDPPVSVIFTLIIQSPSMSKFYRLAGQTLQVFNYPLASGVVLIV